ncbi:hypothetical protein [Maridesulfovibrio bastinii]|uniref:hypothetical protein n=1 Tax=Maridesulfovibrio bastinii TaxID=47157 RepID=UPI00040C47C7|nr:hypothetical protein [Maridesulfovibrio bastinii]
MKNLKLPLIVFAIVFVVTAGVLFFVLKPGSNDRAQEKPEAPGWVNNDGSSGKIKVGDGLPTFKFKNATEKPEEKNIKEEPQPEKTEQKTEEKAEEVAPKVSPIIAFVSDIFLDNLAEYTVDHYYPAGALPKTPSNDISTVSFKSICNYFGLNLRGLISEAPSLLAARREIWKKLLTPGNIQKIYDAHSDRFIDLLEEKSITAEKKFSDGATRETRSLTKAERVNLFRVSAKPLRQTAVILNTIASNSDLVKAMDGYVKAQKRVETSNAVFQTALSEAESDSNVTTRNKATHAGKLLKSAIVVREKIKSGIIEKINSLCGGKCDSADSFYAAKWVYRRTRHNNEALKSILSGADLLSRLADKMDKRAEMISKNL